MRTIGSTLRIAATARAARWQRLRASSAMSRVKQRVAGSEDANDGRAASRDLRMKSSSRALFARAGRYSQCGVVVVSSIDPASALVLFSGGQDSTVCLAWALERFARVETLGFDYGQRHRAEREARVRVREVM